MFRIYESKPIYFLISQNISADLKVPKVEYNLHYGRCTGRFLGLPHGTKPAAVTTNKNIKMSSFKSSENTVKHKVSSEFLRTLNVMIYQNVKRKPGNICRT